MASKKPLEAFVTARTTKAKKLAFEKRALNDGGASELIRKIIDAYLDDRLVIRPDPNAHLLHKSK